MKRASTGRCAWLEVGILKQNAAASRAQAILGKVTRSRARRPNVSIVGTAGQAKLHDVRHSADNRIQFQSLLTRNLSVQSPKKTRGQIFHSHLRL